MAAWSAQAGASARWQTTFNFAGGDGSDGWTTADTPGGAYGFGQAGPLGSDQPGQWIYPTGNTTYTTGYGGTWSYRAPGRGAVMTAAYGPITRRDDTDHQFLRVALGPGPGPASNGGAAHDQTAFTAPPTVPTTYNGIVLTAPGSGLAWVNDSLLTSDCSGNPGGRHGCPPAIPPPATDPTDYPFLRVSSVTLTLTDPEPPTATVAGQLAALTARGWTNTRASVPVLVSAADPTSGVASMSISDEHSIQALSMPAGCDPTHHQPYGGRVCPPTATANLNFNIGALGEGIHTLTASATDYSAQTSRPTRLTLRIDRTPPRMLPLHATPRGRGTRIAWPSTAKAAPPTTRPAPPPQGQPPGPWQPTHARQLIIPTTTPLTVEARATDHAANTGTPAGIAVSPSAPGGGGRAPRRRRHRAPHPRHHRHRRLRAPATGCGTLRFAPGPIPRSQRAQPPVACSARANNATITRLAHLLQPALYFSIQEHWGPLDLDRLFSSEPVIACPSRNVTLGQCRTLGFPHQLLTTRENGVSFDTNDAFLALNAPGARLDNPGSFRSTQPGCVHDQLLDCEYGRFYYHGAIVRLRDDPSIMLVKLDYWIFYRFNHAPYGKFLCSGKVGAKLIRYINSGACDEHQSDWEGLSISVPLTVRTPHTVNLRGAVLQYAQHQRTREAGT